MNIFIEMYKYAVDPVELKEEDRRIINEVRELFHAHRNLCEDLYDVTIFKPFQLQMKLKGIIRSQWSKDLYTNLDLFL